MTVTSGTYLPESSSAMTVAPAMLLKNACFGLIGYTVFGSTPMASMIRELISTSVFASNSGSVTCEKQNRNSRLEAERPPGTSHWVVTGNTMSEYIACVVMNWAFARTKSILRCASMPRFMFGPVCR